MKNNNGCLTVFAIVLVGLVAWLMLPPARTSESKPDPLPVAGMESLPTKRAPLPAAEKAPEVVDPALGMAYVEANLERARAGDHRAQFHVGRILSYCAITYDGYMATGRLEPDGNDWTFCNSFEKGSPDYAEGQDWIAQAREGNDPLAVLTKAYHDFVGHSGQRGTREKLDEVIARVESLDDPEVQALLENVRAMQQVMP
jgi:hypothetical protein